MRWSFFTHSILNREAGFDNSRLLGKGPFADSMEPLGLLALVICLLCALRFARISHEVVQADYTRRIKSQQVTH